MKWKTTAILLAVTVGMGAYVALYDIKRPGSDEQQILAKQVVSLPADEVTRLQVATPSGAVTLERLGAEWRLSSPLATRADAPLIRRILQALDPLDAERELRGSNDHPLALSTYGLEPARGTLAVARGDKTTTLEFGDPTAVGGQRYLRLAGSPTVWVVSSRLFDTLAQPVEAYRSHELLSFDTWRATSVQVEVAGQPAYHLHRTGEAGSAWQLVEPSANQPDPSAASAILNTLRNLKIQRFITETPQVEDVSRWGLDQPLAHVTVEAEGKTWEVFVGNPADQEAGWRYTKRVDEPTIYAINARDVEALPDRLKALLEVPKPPAPPDSTSSPAPASP